MLKTTIKISLILSLFLSTSIISAKVLNLKESAVFILKRTGVVKSVKESKGDKEREIVTIIFLNEDQIGVSLSKKITNNLKVGSIVNLLIQENRILNIELVEFSKKSEEKSQIIDSLKEK